MKAELFRVPVSSMNSYEWNITACTNAKSPVRPLAAPVPLHPQPMGVACWPHVQAPCSRPCFRARGRRPSSPLVARARVYDAYPRNPPAFPPRFRVAAHSYDRAQSWWSRLFGGTPRHLLSSLTVPVRRPQTSAIVVPTAIAAVNALIAHVCDAAPTPSEQYEEAPQ